MKQNTLTTHAKRKVWDIPGGVHPAENKLQSTSTPISQISLPKNIILPLNQHIGAEAEPIVDIGDRVLKGQMIAKANGLISAAVHASTSGTVVAIDSQLVPHPSGLTAPCITIECDGEDEWVSLDACEDYTTLSPRVLIDKIRNAGIAGMGGAGFPTSPKLTPRGDKINTLILNGTECEPYITADDMLMRERANDIVQGALLLAHILNSPREILIGIEDNKPEAIAAMQSAAKNTAIDIVVFPTKYPSGGEKQLIQILTGKEVPSSQLPSKLGIVVQNVGTALAAWRAVKYGEPLISRVTTVVGESLQSQRNVDVLIGTPIDHVLDAHGFDSRSAARLIIGGPMMGYTIEHTQIPVIKTTNCILAPTKNEMPEAPPAQPCIRCGMCAEACPINLLPQQLYWYSGAEDFEKLESHNLFDCIECGACSYVCPSNIPLVQYYRASKGTIKQLNFEKNKSDHSRQRFEFRKLRLEQEAAEKEAKRAARKQAAESNKASTETKVVKDAINKANKPDESPDKTLAKLKRSVSSAESRLERALKQLHDAQTENLDNARIETLTARLKQAEQNVSETQRKLSEFQTSLNDIKITQEQLTEKITTSKTDINQQKIDKLKRQIDVANQKLQEAIDNQSSTAPALKLGLEKLQAKLTQAEEINETADEVVNNNDPTLTAADKAIEKAKQKSAQMALMTDEEKHAEQIISLEKRLNKARQRLENAERENNENIDAFRLGVEKLQQKLSELKK